MKDVMKKQRQARRNIIRQWTALPRDKRQSVEQIAAYAKTAAQQNENSSTAVAIRTRKSWAGYCRAPACKGAPILRSTSPHSRSKGINMCPVE
jgi:hypothetical protein